MGITEIAHVVQAVGEFDQQHPPVLAMAMNILRIVAAAGPLWIEFQSVELVTVNDGGDLRPNSLASHLGW